ncbi:hypothetical protein GGR42_001720 [Saonia flava]|uniref:DinB-like domain-containing protein n=1 Tax=Saonia flava TaxID=523696 RepID=A0A846QT77_9FLAO|nr:DinB family protein [Saonia flava]NJB71258.1 hypothetical protein [Saonia flava]
MEKLFDITEKNRKSLFKFLTETPKEHLLMIPEGFNNNIWWNIAHVVVTEQLLMYKMSGLPMMVSDELVNKYRKGTSPDGTVTEGEMKSIEKLIFSTIEKTKTDYVSGIFKDYDEYTTSVNVTIRNVEDAFAFNLYHEGMHLGYILALRRAIAN